MKALILDKKVKYVNHTFTTPIIIKSNEVELINCRSEDIQGDKLIAVEIAVDNYTLESHVCNNVDIGIIVDGKNCKVSKCTINGYTEDALRFCKDYANIEANVITNYTGSSNAHHDAIQFYSGNQDFHYSWKERYEIGHVLKGCTIKDNIIYDTSSYVQGIFCSDGLLGNFVVTGNVVELPNSNHSISIRGLQRGYSVVSYNTIVGAKMRIEKARRDPKNIGGELKVKIIEGSKPEPDTVNDYVPAEPIVPIEPAKKYRYEKRCTRSWRTLWFKRCEWVRLDV